MTISYKWLSEYIPVPVEPDRLAKILTSVGLEVESFEIYEEIKGGLNGLIIGEVLSTEKHPNADKLTLTKVSIGNEEPLQIVCGAPNVAAGQKVIVAVVGTTIYPVNNEPLTMKVAKIRGVESHGMICAEDEIGLGTSHDGILVLDPALEAGTPAATHFQPYQDWIYEIGITPNRMDAMSHWGVARDVCAYLSHHEKQEINPKLPVQNGFKADNQSYPVSVVIENTEACRRYSGISISGMNITESPKWMQQRLKAIGVNPINNIVDITNYIQHETGQPLHAFDLDAVKGNKIIVKTLNEGSLFTTLDEKERKLSQDDLMICNESEGMCIAGVYGGIQSGVTAKTKNIFLESAWFNPVNIRKTSFRHGLRTDAATRFEKNVDISNTVNVLKRAARMIQEYGKGQIASDVVDIYPEPAEKVQVSLKNHYLKKLSGKNYHADSVKGILSSLGFDIVKEGLDELRVAVPFSKPDISLPADLVEEILRIDGLDNITIPGSITITPSVEENYTQYRMKEKISEILVGMGFHEMLTNSITNAAYYTEQEKSKMVVMMNSLSTELNILRPSLLETSLESVIRNLNHKNQNIRFFEFGKKYEMQEPGVYHESEQLCLVVTGQVIEDQWNQKGRSADLFYLKGVLQSLFSTAGVIPDTIAADKSEKLQSHIIYNYQDKSVATAGEVSSAVRQQFGIKQPVFFATLNWQDLLSIISSKTATVKELPRFPAVMRDLSVLVPKELPFEKVESLVSNLKLDKLQDVKLFDIFESEKLGADKKSLALNFIFQDEQKTLTDTETEAWMQKIMTSFEKELGAEIRKK